MEEDIGLEIDNALLNSSNDRKLGDNEELMNFDDLKGNWVKNPQVGQETEILTTIKLVKNKNIDAKTKEGKAFKVNLSGVDFKVDVHTSNGVYSPASWETWGKMKTMYREAGKIAGVRFKVAHIADGMSDKKAKDEKKCYKVTWFKDDNTTKEFF